MEKVKRITMDIDDRDYLLACLKDILDDNHCQQYREEICEAFSKYIVPETSGNLKPFDLDAAKAGKPVCTRDARKVRILCFDIMNKDFPIIAAVKENGEDIEYVASYTKEGKYCSDDLEENDFDLMMVLEKKEGWIVKSKNYRIYQSKEGAEMICNKKYQDVVKIIWEE